MQSEAELFFWEENYPFMTNNKNLGKREKIKTRLQFTFDESEFIPNYI
jgi:hypothetical protein